MFGSNRNKTMLSILLALFLLLEGRVVLAAESITGAILDINCRQYTFEENTKELITGTDGGGSIIAYYDVKVLKKIDLRVVLSNKAILYSFFYFANNSIIIERQERFQEWDEDKQAFAPGAYKPAEKAVFLLNSTNQRVNKISEDEKKEELPEIEGKSLADLANNALKWTQSQEVVVNVENQVKGK